MKVKFTAASNIYGGPPDIIKEVNFLEDSFELARDKAFRQQLGVFSKVDSYIVSFPKNDTDCNVSIMIYDDYIE